MLAQGLPLGASRAYAALAERGDELAQSQQYLTPEEEKAIVKFLLLMSNFGHPVRIKFMSSLAFSSGCGLT
ncbi:hypothetical protein GQ44DRAFT_600821 [Phaeosphaeriaceae sp. PMI808]|nr:hypothetical protein GQ44DRAFT_600821 [Phaeosphaeriaceae sp. PMI808]